MITENKYYEETVKHKKEVSDAISLIVNALLARAINHDYSKLESPEKDGFINFTEKLKSTTFGSDEYNQFLKDLKPTLDHHYFHNRHHPEHYPESLESYCSKCKKTIRRYCTVITDEFNPNCPHCGYTDGDIHTRYTLKGMTLVDLVEMFCDWYAATKRHEDGSIMKSIEINKERFNISDDLVNIFINTAELNFKVKKDLK
jgi:hypothetical protein